MLERQRLVGTRLVRGDSCLPVSSILHEPLRRTLFRGWHPAVATTWFVAWPFALTTAVMPAARQFLAHCAPNALALLAEVGLVHFHRAGEACARWELCGPYALMRTSGSRWWGAWQPASLP